MRKVANPPNEEIPIDYIHCFFWYLPLWNQSQCIHIVLYIAVTSWGQLSEGVRILFFFPTTNVSSWKISKVVLVPLSDESTTTSTDFSGSCKRW